MKRNKVAIDSGTPMTDEERFQLGAKGKGNKGSSSVKTVQAIEGSTKVLLTALCVMCLRSCAIVH